MEELNKKISKIRALMKDLKAEKYAIVNPDLAMLDTHKKSLYLKVLCTVVQYENRPSEMQALYFKRIVKGIGVGEPSEEYMRKALEISDVDIKEFISFMQGNIAKYYFALDSMLLVAMGSSNQQNYEYLAEILELCGVRKRDLEYLSLIAKSVLRQDSSYYEEAKGLLKEEEQVLDFKPYISSYYVGAIVDNEYVKHYSAPNKELSLGVKFPNKYTAGEITFSNLAITISEEWKIKNCEKVLFEDCDIHGNENSIVLDTCKSVIFRNCKISGFSNYAIVKRLVGKLAFIECEFTNCFYTYERWCIIKDKIGGVIHLTESVGENDLATRIEKCVFTNCGGRNLERFSCSAVISNDICEILDSKFINCWNYCNNNGKDSKDGEGTLFAIGSKSENNELMNSGKLI